MRNSQVIILISIIISGFVVSPFLASQIIGFNILEILDIPKFKQDISQLKKDLTQYKSESESEIKKYKHISKQMIQSKNDLQLKYEQLQKENDEYKNQSEKTIQDYKTYSEKLEEKYNQLQTDNLKNVMENKKLETELDEVQTENIETRLDLAEAKSYSDKYQSDLDDLRKILEEESNKPRTIIYDQKVNWDFNDLKGNHYSWSMPIETYESYIRAYEPQDRLSLKITSTGEVISVRDHTKFVQNVFTNVIDNIYDNSENNADFVKEVWYVVAQLTTYSYEIDEDPRWALETLSRGGGDCEDTAILIIDMLKSSKHTQNWKIELVYFDSDNPQNPKTMNHVAVHINDGQYDYLVESTAKDDPYAWPNGVTGWYFEV